MSLDVQCFYEMGEGRLDAVNSFGYHNTEPEGVYAAVTMEMCLSTVCYVIKF